MSTKIGVYASPYRPGQRDLAIINRRRERRQMARRLRAFVGRMGWRIG